MTAAAVAMLIYATLATLPPADAALVGRIEVVPRAALVHPASCAETWLYARPVIRVAVPEGNCQLGEYPFFVRHEVGHAVCWVRGRDASEACAEAYAYAHGGRGP